MLSAITAARSRELEVEKPVYAVVFTFTAGRAAL